MKAVLYLRYSSHSQTEQSIEGQDRVCTNYCERNNIILVDRYIDRATSASKETDKRTEFLRMIKDSAKHGFDAIVVYKLDRFARNRYDSAIYKNILKKNGVRLISATEEIGDSPESVILEAVLEGVAEYYSLELSQKVKRGMLESALKASSNGGRTPLGYTAVDKKLVINEEEAQVVREIFNRFGSGESSTSILRDLKRRRVRARSGKDFSWTSMSVILRNRKYMGDYVFDTTIIPDAIPPIVSKDLFHAVEVRLQNTRGRNSRKSNADYKLTGKIFCGHCNSHMTGCSGKNRKGIVQYYYACQQRRKKATCKSLYVQRDKIEKAVVQCAMETLSPDTIQALAKSAAEQSEREALENTDILRLTKEIKGLQEKANGLTSALALSSPLVQDYLSGQIHKVLQEKQELEIELDKLKRTIVILTEEGILAWLTQFIEGDVDDQIFRQRVIDLLVNSVTVWTEDDGWKVRIVFNLQKEQTELKIGKDAPPFLFWSNHIVIDIKIARE